MTKENQNKHYHIGTLGIKEINDDTVTALTSTDALHNSLQCGGVKA